MKGLIEVLYRYDTLMNADRGTLSENEYKEEEEEEEEEEDLFKADAVNEEDSERGGGGRFIQS